ncbi:LysR family transcriptional regulator [Desulfitobacterium chlororespirans]|uniref:DNA-binding transcriptional regulator, LysR family n=1 Tax=Desulfitobacterium chlororespirans DSM 11544 TaxID=1121395 RepID=A0A1M7SYT6_9FIRM|nr:LysR family transcriptional regulator [Desulfitobacterium chlororespirans]SHN63675.1 DNA-binding transcriptional regulator, LysR family [Desulfitobacterium chlororespirans DSM 11544]
MDLFDLRCFLSVAKHLNLSLAAKEMFISQPSMSVKINGIEEDFGVKLFNRTRHKVELTPAGESAQKDFAYILEYYEKAKVQAKKISESQNNHLCIGYHGPTEWANIHELVQEFHKKFPHIEIDVVVATWGALTHDLVNGRLDVMFNEQSEIDDITMLDSVYLFRDYVAIAVSKSSPLAQLKKIKPEALKNEKIIMSNNKYAVKSLKVVIERLSDAGFDMENARLVDHYDTTIAMASAGMGIAPIPRSFKIAGHQSVAYVDIDSDKVYEDFVLAWRNNNEKPAVHLFKDFCKQHEWHVH